ncbi:MAG: OmpA family protein [Sphingomonas sp.]|nr:OmpA family protein [Sphingomonas sp.]
MSLRWLMVLPALLGASLASAQPYDPYAYPAPPPAYPQPGPGYPGVQGPVLAIPVLEQDLKAKAGSNIVRFGRDSYVLNPQAQSNLTAQAQWLILHPFVQASIEGHADGRQTRDYAMALGERRAAAVRNYLIASGVPPEQLQIVSWGRERPETAAFHDAAWLQNSRVVTVLKQPPQLQPWLPQPQPLPEPR